MKTITEKLPEATAFKTRKGAQNRLDIVRKTIDGTPEARGAVSMIHQREDGMFIPVIYLPEAAHIYATFIAINKVCVIG